ncbi:MAG: hypothetical protein H6719_22595 [Sandaracinaceae bacterium]|nr:hypothetical protein [Sandaracinaceae bacterium]
MTQRSKAPIVIGVVVVVLLIGVPLVAWLLRGVIATSIARSQLEERGIACDSRFSVSPSATLGEATVGPTRCTREGGVLEAIELMSDFTVELDGTEPSSIRGDSLRIVLRSANVRGGDGWAEALARINLEQRMAAVVKGLSELSRLDLPPVRAGRVELVRGSDQLGHAENLTLTPEAGDRLGLAFTRAHFAAGPMGVGQLDLTGVTGDATPATVTLRGQASARAGVAIVFSVERAGPFTVQATGLDTASPSFHLDGNL